MKKKECPSCAMEVDARSNTCPICGYGFTLTQRRKWIAIFLLILIVIYAMYKIF